MVHLLFCCSFPYHSPQSFFELLFFKNKNQAKIIPVFHATVLHQVLRDFFVTGLGDVVLFKMSEHSLGKDYRWCGLSFITSINK